MKTIIVLFLLIAFVLVGLSIGLELMQIDSQVNNAQIMRAQEIIGRVGSEAWEFSSPLLQLVVVILVIQWILTRANVKVSLSEIPSTNVQVFIAILIIGTFCISALGNLPGMSYTKDLALIVIGFYFGTRTKSPLDPLVAKSDPTETQK